MGTINVSLPSDGETADVADVNTPITTIVNEINGNLSNENIASGAAIDGSKLASGGVTSTQIDFGGAGVGIWWEEIARTTLTSAADTITVSSIPTRKYLRVLVTLLNTGGTINGTITLNNDTGTNYTRRVSDNGASDATSTSQSGTSGLIQTNTAAPIYADLLIYNVATGTEKIIVGESHGLGAAGAATVSVRREHAYKWANTSAQVNRIDITHNGTGDYAIGSEVIVLGHD